MHPWTDRRANDGVGRALIFLSARRNVAAVRVLRPFKAKLREQEGRDAIHRAWTRIRKRPGKASGHCHRPDRTDADHRRGSADHVGRIGLLSDRRPVDDRVGGTSGPAQTPRRLALCRHLHRHRRLGAVGGRAERLGPGAARRGAAGAADRRGLQPSGAEARRRRRSTGAQRTGGHRRFRPDFRRGGGSGQQGQGVEPRARRGERRRGRPGGAEGRRGLACLGRFGQRPALFAAEPDHQGQCEGLAARLDLPHRRPAG